jgi:cytochrome c biogenesis factor
VQASERLYAAYDVLLADGTKIGTVEPHTDAYPTGNHAGRAVIMGGWDHDLFVVPDETFEQDSRTVPLRVVVFPLVRFVWLGSILLCVGAAVSLWLKPRRQEQEARATSLDQEGVVPDSMA